MRVEVGGLLFYNMIWMYLFLGKLLIVMGWLFRFDKVMDLVVCFYLIYLVISGILMKN